MEIRYNCIPTLKNALNRAMNGGKYNFLKQADFESDFLMLIEENLRGTELEPYINDVTQCIYQYMALTDERDFLMDKLEKTNKEKN